MYTAEVSDCCDSVHLQTNFMVIVFLDPGTNYLAVQYLQCKQFVFYLNLPCCIVKNRIYSFRECLHEGASLAFSGCTMQV